MMSENLIELNIVNFERNLLEFDTFRPILYKILTESIM